MVAWEEYGNRQNDGDFLTFADRLSVFPQSKNDGSGFLCGKYRLQLYSDEDGTLVSIVLTE